MSGNAQYAAEYSFRRRNTGTEPEESLSAPGYVHAEQIGRKNRRNGKSSKKRRTE